MAEQDKETYGKDKGKGNDEPKGKGGGDKAEDKNLGQVAREVSEVEQQDEVTEVAQQDVGETLAALAVAQVSEMTQVAICILRGAFVTVVVIHYI